MARFFFHVTDGDRLEIDRDGSRIPAGAAVETIAAEQARAAMGRIGPTLDWSDWIVAVYDEIGNQVSVVSFPDAQALGGAPRSVAERARRRTVVRKPGRVAGGVKRDAGRSRRVRDRPHAS